MPKLTPVLDENGHVKLDENGNVVYDNGNGQQSGYDLGVILENSSKYNAEAASRRKDLEAANAKLLAYDGVDLDEYHSLKELKSSLDAGKLVEIGKIDDVKRQAVEHVGKKHEEDRAAWKANDEKKDALIASQQKDIFESKLFQAAQSDPRLKGFEAGFILNNFGGRFELREDEDGKRFIVGKNKDGSDMLSDDMTRIATAAEALSAIAGQDNNFRHLYMATVGGSGSMPSMGKGTHNPWAKETYNQTEQAKIYKENPAQARQLMKQAGVPVPAGM